MLATPHTCDNVNLVECCQDVLGGCQGVAKVLWVVAGVLWVVAMVLCVIAWGDWGWILT